MNYFAVFLKKAKFKVYVTKIYPKLLESRNYQLVTSELESCLTDLYQLIHLNHLFM